MSYNLVICLLFISLVSWGSQVSGQTTQHDNLDEEGVALQGYDPVAYFTAGEAIEGSETLQYTYQGATYFFARQENLDQFKGSPDQYLPQYGGWCAYAMGASGEKVRIDPETFKLKDGKLYLFYNFYFNNTLKKWNEDESALKKKADQYWLQLNQ